VSMFHSTDRILTTHVGSLPRPAAVLDLMKARLTGQPVDAAAYDARIAQAVRDIVKDQAGNGVDIVSDGEASKPGFTSYVRERLGGFEARPGGRGRQFSAEVNAFPEYYEAYFGRAMYGAALVPLAAMVCVGPVTYVGQAALAKDLANLKGALAGVDCTGAFVPASAPSGVGSNAYYKTDEDYFHAVGEALRTEYQAIVDAGFLLQIDDPYLSEVFGNDAYTPEEKARRADLHVEAINHALRGIPPEKVRFHTCYGINEGPRVYEASLGDVVGHMLRVNAGSYSFEAANARHEHEYHLWETVKLPAGKVIVPGVITHASNIVEHHELIAERLVRFAERVGRENVIASADCGFSSQACYRTEVDPKVMWAKFRSMAEGARIASQRLWGKKA
jgi:5-methyltetrahydropteroyltriglutamate--homocysteine methyltransferase